MLDFLKKFKKHIHKMEQEFEDAIWTNQQMNMLLVSYEKKLISCYGEDANQSKTVIVGQTIVAQPEMDN